MILRVAGLLALLSTLAAPARALPTVINADVETGRVLFDAAVAEGGGSLRTQGLRLLRDGAAVFDFDDFTISASNGVGRFVEDDYMDLRAHGHRGALSGWAIGLSVNDPADAWGLTFSFDHPVNAFGLELGDWATCCYPSGLNIAFDGGATRRVAVATQAGDNPGVAAYGQFTNFVGAFDTSGSFTRVTLYGDGVGEVLVGGGTIRYATLPTPADDGGDIGPLSVPEPGGLQLALGALATLGAMEAVSRGAIARQGRRRGGRHRRGPSCR